MLVIISSLGHPPTKHDDGLGMSARKFGATILNDEPNIFHSNQLINLFIYNNINLVTLNVCLLIIVNYKCIKLNYLLNLIKYLCKTLALLKSIKILDIESCQ